MRITNSIRAIPRGVVDGYLRAGRLPLTLTERIARQQDNEKWAPSLAFEKVQAGVEANIGRFLRDDVLAAKGRLRGQKVEQLQRAAKIETVARHERDVANDTFERRLEDAERTRTEAQRTATKQERGLHQQAEVRERKADQKAAQKAAAARSVKQQQDKAIDRRERMAKSEALAKQSEALDAAKDALDAERTVDVIGDTLEGTQEARKTS